MIELFWKYLHHIHCFVLGVFVGVNIMFFTVVIK